VAAQRRLTLVLIASSYHPQSVFVSEGPLSCQLVLVGENVCVWVSLCGRESAHTRGRTQERAHKREHTREKMRARGRKWSVSSQVTYDNEPHVTWCQVMGLMTMSRVSHVCLPHVCLPSHTKTLPMSHMSMRHVTQRHESCHTCQ